MPGRQSLPCSHGCGLPATTSSSALFSLLLAGLDTRFTASLQADAVPMPATPFAETKKALATLPEDIPDGSAELFSQHQRTETETQQSAMPGCWARQS